MVLICAFFVDANLSLLKCVLKKKHFGLNIVDNLNSKYDESRIKQKCFDQWCDVMLAWLRSCTGMKMFTLQTCFFPLKMKKNTVENTVVSLD